MRRFPRFLLIPVAFLVAVTALLVWALTPLGPSTEALGMLQSDEAVVIQVGRFTEFIPREGKPDSGLIIYPGGRVDWRSYAALARSIAEKGFYVAIVPMPLSLAVLAPDSAAGVIASRPDIRNWSVGGHSLGGAMAANFAYNNPDQVAGLVLWAAYPAGSDDLSQSGIKVISISADLDGLADREKITASRNLLPADTVWVEIQGGNHAQFGSYGTQPGDGVAVISAVEQAARITAATADFLSGLQD